MSITKLGNSVTKSNDLETVSQTVPASEDRITATNSLQSTFGGGHSIVTQTGNSSITYGKRDRGSKAMKANPCRHLTTQTVYGGSPSSPTSVVDSGVGHTYVMYTHHYQSADTHSSAIGACKAAFGGSLRGSYLESNGLAHMNDAMVRTKPNLTTVSLPNILIDIKQIRMLFAQWKKSLGIAKNLAGAHLNYKFGWKPMLGDLAALAEALLLLKGRLSAFERACGTLQKYQETYLSETVSKSGTFTYGGASLVCSWKGTITRTCVAHLTFRIMPLKAVGDLKMVLNAGLDALGIELNPVIIWDAIPFSFVVDWFFDVGGFLGRYSTDSFELPVVLIDSYLQYKELIVIESSLQTSVGNTQQKPWPRSGSWVTSEKFFHRVPLYPDFATLQGLGFKMPSFGQAVLGLSLATILARGDVGKALRKI